MWNEGAILIFLKDHFADLKRRNPAFSLRAYSKKLGTSPGELSQILGGKRKITEKKLEQFFDRLNVDPIQRAQILTVGRKEAKDVLRLRSDEFDLIADPIHHTILAMMRMKSFQSDAHWIADQLDKPAKTIKESLERLSRLGMIETKTKPWKRKFSGIHTTDDIPSAAIRKAHHQDCETMKSVLDDIPIELRDFCSITVALDTNKISELKTLTRKFLKDASDLVTTTESDRAYRFFFSAFPLQRKGKL